MITHAGALADAKEVQGMLLFAAQHGVEPARFVGWDIAGLVLWLIGFLFESVGDFQLARFKADPVNRGKVMDRGLWRYTRHPTAWAKWPCGGATSSSRGQQGVGGPSTAPSS